MEQNRFAQYAPAGADGPPSQPSHAADAAPDAPAPAPVPAHILDFPPVPVRSRAGWTPERQREYVEALADTGLLRAAAARVGMTEQSAAWLRRRADARGFDRACHAALRIGARRILNLAFERAVEGTIKRHYYHGELVSEERVFDNRLLIALLGRLPGLDEAPPTEDVEQDWDRWMDAVEAGLAEPAAPDPEPEPGTPSQARGPDEPQEVLVWEDEGTWLTDCLPPPGFDRYQSGTPGDRFYQRMLTQEEQDWWNDGGRDEVEDAHGYDGDLFYHLGRPFFLPLGYEKSEKSAPAFPRAGGEDEDEDEAGFGRW
jgi:hypothetical protein